MSRLLIAALPLLLITPAFAQEAREQHGNPAPQTREHAEQREQMIFEQLDTNHDGTITQNEIAAFTRLMGDNPRITARVTKMFAESDANHDGKVSAAEARARVNAAFDAADTNHDGVLTAEERQAARQKSSEQSPQ